MFQLGIVLLGFFALIYLFVFLSPTLNPSQPEKDFRIADVANPRRRLRADARFSAPAGAKGH